MDQGRAVHVIYLDFSKAFNTVSHNILVDNLKKYDLDKWAGKLVENNLRDGPKWLLTVTKSPVEGK